MENGSKKTLRQRWDALQPSKTMLVWACAGSVAATLIVGFTWGGWVTGGTARDMAGTAGDTARGELASVICVENFLAAPDAGVHLAELKGLNSGFQQRQFIENAGWATMPGTDTANRRAADLCARVLANLELEEVAVGQPTEASVPAAQ